MEGRLDGEALLYEIVAYLCSVGSGPLSCLETNASLHVCFLTVLKN